MKKLILTSALLSSLITVKAVQLFTNINTGFSYQVEEGTDQKVAEATKKYNLTAEQQTKYREYIINYDKDKKIVLEKYRTTSEQERKAAQQKFTQKYNAQLKSILTAEQWKLHEPEKTAK